MLTVTEIYQEMKEAFATETGVTINDGGEMAIRFYTLASQIYGLYVQNAWTLNQCFPQSASGEYLDQHATLRGLERNEAQKAQGELRFYLDEASASDVDIPVGTIAMTAGLVSFVTTEAGVISAGDTYGDVATEALLEGSSGNVPAGMIRTMSVAPVGVSYCDNVYAFVGGSEDEDDESLRERVLETYQRMPNGANSAYYEREAMEFDDVVAVNVIGRARGLCTVDVVISDATGEPDEALLTEVETYLQEQREIAVDVQVLAPTLIAMSPSVNIEVSSAYDFDEVAALVQSALLGYFDGSILGESILRVKLGQLVYDVDGVENYEIVSPSADVIMAQGELAKVNTVTVGAMS